MLVTSTMIGIYCRVSQCKITVANLNRLSKLFHLQIPKEICNVSRLNIFHLTCSVLIHYLTRYNATETDSHLDCHYFHVKIFLSTSRMTNNNQLVSLFTLMP